MRSFKENKKDINRFILQQKEGNRLKPRTVTDGNVAYRIIRNRRTLGQLLRQMITRLVGLIMAMSIASVLCLRMMQTTRLNWTIRTCQAEAKTQEI